MKQRIYNFIDAMSVNYFHSQILFDIQLKEGKYKALFHSSYRTIGNLLPTFQLSTSPTPDLPLEQDVLEHKDVIVPTSNSKPLKPHEILFTSSYLGNDSEINLSPGYKEFLLFLGFENYHLNNYFRFRKDNCFMYFEFYPSEYEFSHGLSIDIDKNVAFSVDSGRLDADLFISFFSKLGVYHRSQLKTLMDNAYKEKIIFTQSKVLSNFAYIYDSISTKLGKEK